MKPRRASARKKAIGSPGVQLPPTSHTKKSSVLHATRSATSQSQGSSLPRIQGTTAHESHSSTLITRRRFLYGAVGAGIATTAVVGGAFAFSGATEAQGADEEITVLKVPTDAVSTSDECVEIEDISSSVSLVGSFELPYGTLIWSNNDTLAACLLPTTESARPLAQISFLYLGSGENRIILEEAVGQAEGFDIYDVRASEQGLIWTEANILDGIWRIYTATYSDAGLGTPALVDEGDAENWETPTIAAVGSYAFWQVLPALGGLMTAEASLLKRAQWGSSDTETTYTSIGRMSTAPYPLVDSLVITPRTDSTTINYQLTLIEAKSGDVLDSLILPTSMKPLEAGYGTNGFTFSFDARYNYGEGIANIGTYTPTEVYGTDDYSAMNWFSFSRTPTAAPAWCNGWFIVKSTRSVCGVDIANKQYFALPVESGCDDYGDYLATTGSTSSFVTFTNVDDTAVDGTEKHFCLVRVWSPVVA